MDSTKYVRDSKYKLVQESNLISRIMTESTSGNNFANLCVGSNVCQGWKSGDVIATVGNLVMSSSLGNLVMSSSLGNLVMSSPL
jgi:hypothetical protein